jgi:hypothetical protein
MTRKAASLSFVLLFGIAIAVSYAGWSIYRENRTEFCGFSGRPILPQTKTVVLMDGENETVCCPACVLTERVQTGKTIQFVELTDFETGKALAPKDAFVVRGSAVNLCVTQHTLMEEDKQAAPLEFDRCMPSLVAFARREAAERFLRENGGTLISFQELVSDSNQ